MITRWFGRFIATPDEPKFVAEYPSLLFGITETIEEGEYGFGGLIRRTSYALVIRPKISWNDGSTSRIVAGVYMALMVRGE